MRDAGCEMLLLGSASQASGPTFEPKSFGVWNRRARACTLAAHEPVAAEAAVSRLARDVFLADHSELVALQRVGCQFVVL